MKIGDEVYIHGYVDEIRQNVVIIRNDGGYFGTVAEEITSRSEIPNKSEIPTSCGDAISREKLIEALDTWDKFGYAPTHELILLRSKVNKDKYVPYIHYDDAIKCIKGMPSVSPQQRTGRWIPTGYDGYADGNPVYDWWECSKCGWEHTGDEESLTAFCPNCGARMEVEE